VPIIFTKNRGRVVRMDDPAAQGTVGYVQVTDAPIRYASQWAIITRITISHQANVQFLHTLGSAVYIYVFGDRIGQLGLSGLAFNANCDYPDGPLGIERMMVWYRENRISTRGAPVRVLVGSTPIEAFVTSSTEDAIDAESGLVQFGLNMQILPEAGSRRPQTGAGGPGKPGLAPGVPGGSGKPGDSIRPGGSIPGFPPGPPGGGLGSTVVSVPPTMGGTVVSVSQAPSAVAPFQLEPIPQSLGGAKQGQ
jgi:hypothetical protein